MPVFFFATAPFSFSPRGGVRVAGGGYSGVSIITDGWRQSLPPSPLRGPLPRWGENDHDTLWFPPPMGRTLIIPPLAGGGTKCRGRDIQYFSTRCTPRKTGKN